MEENTAEKLLSQHIPGTELMRDVGSIHLLHGPKSHRVLIPVPSLDPHDPLNWKRRLKYVAIAVQAIYCFVVVASAVAVSPIVPLLEAEFEVSDTKLSLLTGACVLALGYANFIIVPVSNIFGRRFTSIMFGLLCVGSCIWEACAHTYNSLLGARVLNGIATATSETLMVQVIADLFFLHERGLWMGVYFTTYFLGLFVGPIISGNISAAHGWRSFFWLSLALSGFNVLSLIFFFPDTKFHRDNTTVTQAVPAASSREDKAETVVQDEDPHRLEVEAVPLGRGRPSRGQFRLINKPDHRWRTFIIRDIITPLRLFTYPIILWAGLCVGGCANLLLLWNLTESSVLGAPPYNFSVSAVGYANFAFVGGGVVGLFTTGRMSDWVADRSTRRNDGIREAEMRLPALLPFFVTTVISIAIGACAEKYHWPWPALLVIGYGFTGLCVTSVPTIAIAYAVDCYKPIAGEVMVVATVLKNTCGFAMSYWVTSLGKSKGIEIPLMVQLAVVAGPVMLGLPLWLWGKKLRWWTRNASVHRFEAEI